MSSAGILLTVAPLTVALLTMALLTVAPLTMALLTVAPLTMALLTMAQLSMALLSMALLSKALLSMAVLTMAGFDEHGAALTKHVGGQQVPTCVSPVRQRDPGGFRSTECKAVEWKIISDRPAVVRTSSFLDSERLGSLAS